MLEDIDDVNAMTREETRQALFGDADSSVDEREAGLADGPADFEDDLMEAGAVNAALEVDEENIEANADGDALPETAALVASARAYAAEKKDVLITGNARRTRPLMSIFEYAALIGERATHIEQGATNIDDRVVTNFTSQGITRALDIAEIEVNTTEAPLPLDIHRRVAPGVYEVWGARELKSQRDILCESYSPEATRMLSAWNGGECERVYTFASRAYMKTFESSTGR